MIQSKLNLSLLLSGLALLCPCSVNGKYSASDVDKFGKLCNANEEDMNSLKNYITPSTDTGKCFLKCIADNIKLYDSYGNYSKPNAQEMLKHFWPETPIDTITKVNDICYSESLKIPPTELRTCNYSYRVMLCIMTQAKRYGML